MESWRGVWSLSLQSAKYKNLDQARRNVNGPALLKYRGESGCDKVLIVDNENAWIWIGRPHMPSFEYLFREQQAPASGRLSAGVSIISTDRKTPGYVR